MKIAIIGSRGLVLSDLYRYIPDYATEIVSGGAVGIDTCAEKYAKEKGLIFTKFLPDYESHSRQAPILRNIDIIDYSDEVIAFWDGKSRGTKFVIDRCNKKNVKITVHIFNID